MSESASSFTHYFKGFEFKELFNSNRLNALDEQFLVKLAQHSPELHQQLLDYRLNVAVLSQKQISQLLLAVAPFVETFIAELFEIQAAVECAQQITLSHHPIFEFKKWFVQRRARRRLLGSPQLTENFANLNSQLQNSLELFFAQQPTVLTTDRELAIALWGAELLKDTAQHAEAIELLTQWCMSVLSTEEGKQTVAHWISFKLPQQTDYAHLVPTVSIPLNNSQPPITALAGHLQTQRQRCNFELSDAGMTARQVQDEIHYCVYCHENEGDFCSKGFPVKKGNPEQGYKTNPLGVTLTGCPLEEHISEMHSLKREGYSIAALAMVMVNNPMCAATGHRICNDCMKACIYQKQDPVNIPQIETRVLSDVLDLPYGVEIYDLLTRWNPLRTQQFVAKPYNGLKVLIAGQGPAGFTLAHHLLMEGFAVVGFDGLKIEPLPPEFLTKPIQFYHQLEELLDNRIMAGFGGVAEYGITVRWDKNFLKLIYLSLARRPYYQVFGGVRFGGTISVEDAWQLGFDHLAVAVGAGLPQALPIEGSLAIGMRQANDFLMALQLTGAAKADSLTNLQVRLPAVVIGGGLTGIDTATEVQVYYLTQIEKLLTRYEILCNTVGESQVQKGLDTASLLILQEMLHHARAVRNERKLAQQEQREPNLHGLLQQWGGVTVVYRRELRDSPAYVRNHEEVTKALEEGIFYLENAEPVRTLLDEYGHVSGLVCRQTNGETSQDITLTTRSIFVATGAKQNVAYEFEHRGTFSKANLFQYQAFEWQTNDEQGELTSAPMASHCKDAHFGAFTSYRAPYALAHRGSGYVSFLGDTHPVFHGSVVKAIASGLRTYPKIVELFQADLTSGLIETQGTQLAQEYQQFRAKMTDLLTARLEKIQRLSPELLEITVRAPQAARQFKAGQFFRLQNFETYAQNVGGTKLQTEAMAMLGTAVDVERGTITFNVLEKGTSARLYSTLAVGTPLSLMGPTGTKTPIPSGGETVLIMGGQLAMVALLAIGKALRQAGNRVLFVATLPERSAVFRQETLAQAADVIVWITAQGEPISPHRSQDCSITGDVFHSLQCYDAGMLQSVPQIRLAEISRVQMIASDELLTQMQVNHAQLLPHRPPITAAVYSTMQCMLKGVCAQCLQWQIDPATGKRTKAVFACSWQEQPLAMIDVNNLTERLKQNALQEHLSNLWLNYLFQHHVIERC